MSSNSGDMFSQMRIGLQFERCMRNDAFNARNRDARAARPRRARRAALGRPPTARTRWASRSAIGSLTPGKQADVIVIGGRRLNMVPMADPVGCLVAQANAANVAARARRRAASSSATASWSDVTSSGRSGWRAGVRARARRYHASRCAAVAAGARRLRRHAERDGRTEPRARVGERPGRDERLT